MRAAARPRRSVLYLPGSNARALNKARSLPADCLILDLEDAVAPDNKGLARSQIAAALADRASFGGNADGQLLSQEDDNGGHTWIWRCQCNMSN